MNISIDSSFCVNLDSRPDRWEQLQRDLSGMNIDIKRVSAITDPRPEKGLFLTVKKIVQMAKEEGLEYFLLLEDDCYPIDKDHIMQVLNDAPLEWDILLGGSYHYSIKSKYNSNWAQVRTFCSLHFTIIHSRMYDRILSLNENHGHLDIVLSNLCKKGEITVYLMYPMLCQQRSGFSDLRKRDVDDNQRKLDWFDSPNTLK